MDDEMDFYFLALMGENKEWDIDVERAQVDTDPRTQYRKQMESLRAKRYGVDGKMDGP